MALKLIFPYILPLCASLLPDVPIKELGTRVGALEAAYTAACVAASSGSADLHGACVAALFIAGLSDRYGRKRTLLGALAGSCVLSTLFGFSTSYLMAFLIRGLSGAFQGAQPVLRVICAESSNRANEARCVEPLFRKC